MSAKKQEPKIAFPVIGKGEDTFPKEARCPWCRERKVLDPHSFTCITGGAILLDEDGDGASSPSNEGFFSVNWHGAHDDGEGSDRDIYVGLDIAEDTYAGNFDIMFCSTACLRAFLNAAVDELEERIAAERTTTDA